MFATCILCPFENEPALHEVCCKWHHSIWANSAKDFAGDGKKRGLTLLEVSFLRDLDNKALCPITGDRQSY